MINPWNAGKHQGENRLRSERSGKKHNDPYLWKVAIFF